MTGTLSNYITAIIKFTASDPAAKVHIPVSYNMLSQECGLLLRVTSDAAGYR